MAHPIPVYYRVPLLYIEPALSLLGSLLLALTPSTFASSMMPRASSSPTLAHSLSELRVLTDQLGILLLLFTFNLAVLLRATRDVTVWRVACAGMLMSDVLHTAASVREVGGGTAGWRAEDWFNFGVLGGMGAVRLGVVLGIGVGEEGNKVKRG